MTSNQLIKVCSLDTENKAPNDELVGLFAYRLSDTGLIVRPSPVMPCLPIPPVFCTVHRLRCNVRALYTIRGVLRR